MNSWCRACGGAAELADLVRVIPLHSGEPYHVHRPNSSGTCFAGVPPRNVALIEATEPNAHPMTPPDGRGAKTDRGLRSPLDPQPNASHIYSDKHPPRR